MGEQLSNILALGVENPAQLMSHLTPRMREMLGRDRSWLIQMASEEVRNILFGWSDTWISLEERENIDEMAEDNTVALRRSMLYG